MVESPMYERLMRLVAAIEKASALDAWDDEHNKVVCGLNEANNSTHHMRTNPAFTGETGDQIDAWTDQAMKQVQAIKDGHNTAMEYYVEARRAMKQVREEAMQLSPTLIDARLQALADAAHVVIPVAKYLGPGGVPINAIAATGEAYIRGLIDQANNQREAAAADVLQRANDTMQGLADGTNRQRLRIDNRGVGGDGLETVSGPSSSSVRRDIERGRLNTSVHEPGVYPGNRDTDYGRSGLRGSGSGLYAGGYDEGGPVNDRAMSSPRIPNRFITEGEVGSRLNPVSDPQDLMDVDLLHTRVNGDRHRRPIATTRCGVSMEAQAVSPRWLVASAARACWVRERWAYAARPAWAVASARQRVPSGVAVSRACRRCARERTRAPDTGPTSRRLRLAPHRAPPG